MSRPIIPSSGEQGSAPVASTTPVNVPMGGFAWNSQTGIFIPSGVNEIIVNPANDNSSDANTP